MSPIGRAALAGFIASRQVNPEEAETLAGLAHGRPGWAVRALTDRDWVERMDRWAQALASLAFEEVDGVLTHATRFGQGPQAEMRVVASDALRGFTAFSELTEPKAVMAVLHEYHAVLGRLIHKYEGTVERFSGDGIAEVAIEG